MELEDEDPKKEDSELQADLTEGRLTEKLFQSLMVSESEPSKKRFRRDAILQAREPDVKDPVVIDLTLECLISLYTHFVVLRRCTMFFQSSVTEYLILPLLLMASRL